jgi:aerobactin synthase
MKNLWQKVNKNLVAKTLTELHFEQIFSYEKKDEMYYFRPQSNVAYRFHAYECAWNHLKVDARSIERFENEISTEIAAAQFFIETQHLTKMSDITLGNFLEEMHNTLASDMTLIEKQPLAAEIANWDGNQIQAILNGHPKILLNKGRVGWSRVDVQKYAPESQQSTQLFWIAIKKNITVTSKNYSLPEEINFEKLCKGNQISSKDYHLMPVHPWQWEQHIATQFISEISQNKIIPLGLHGEHYFPQISLRTLSGNKFDLKLSLSILNTSCIRGIPAKYIEEGQKISQTLEDICHKDDYLKKFHLKVLKEVAGICYQQQDFAKVQNAPYRYHEYLGAIFRESANSKLEKNQKAILTASLSFQDNEGNSLIAEYIKKSNLTPAKWIEQYFKVIILPLYHLQLKHGIGIVAHGQNIMLILENNLPKGLMLKDFQGDLRVSTEIQSELHQCHSLTQLAPNYLIHDLITGHFISVLRFISQTMFETMGFAEKDFYEILKNVMTSYENEHGIKNSALTSKKTFEKLLLNKVRFTIGYGDLSERPLPLLGDQLPNPIFTGIKR